MAGKHTIEIQVLAETKKASKALSDLGQATGLSKLAGVAKKVGLAVVAVGSAAAVGMAAIAVKGVGAAADLEQSVGAVDTVFKGQAGTMHEWAKGAAQSVGLARNEYNELATVIGTQLKNGGTAFDEIGGKTNELVTLGADLSSMFGGSTSDAVNALSSALKGERDPIEKYGVSLKQATIDAKAAELGFTKVGGSLSEEATQAATLALIMEQTADAHGNFGRESDTLQNKQQRLSATLTNISARIGAVLLPAVSALAGWVGDVIVPKIEQWVGVMERNLTPAIAVASAWVTGTLVPALMQFGAYLQANVLPVIAQFGTYLTGTVVPAIIGFGQWILAAQGWLLPLVAGIVSMVAAYRIWTSAVQAWKAIQTLATAAQVLFNAVLAANPIGIIVLLIVGLVAAIVVLYNNNETARRIIDAAWNGIKAIVSSVAGWVTGTAVPAIVNGWNRLKTAVSDLATGISTRFNAIKTAISTANALIASKIQGIVSWMSNLGSSVSGAVSSAVSSFGQFASAAGQKVGQAVQFFQQLPGKIISALSGLAGRMTSVGTQLVQGLISGISNMASRAADAAKNVVSGAINGAKKLLGIKSPSRVFRKIGEQTGEGLEIGLKARERFVTRAAGALATATVNAGTPGPLGLSGSLSAQRGANGAGSRPIEINVSGLLYPTMETGRQIADAVRPFLSYGGAL